MFGFKKKPDLPAGQILITKKTVWQIIPQQLSIIIKLLREIADHFPAKEIKKKGKK